VTCKNITWYLLLSACELTHIFVHGKNIIMLKNISHHHTKFSQLGKQVLGICALLDSGYRFSPTFFIS